MTSALTAAFGSGLALCHGATFRCEGACEIVILSVGPAVSASLIAVLYVRLNQSPVGRSFG